MEEYVLTALVRVLKPVLHVGLTVLARIAHKTVHRQIRCVLTVLACVLTLIALAHLLLIVAHVEMLPQAAVKVNAYVLILLHNACLSQTVDHAMLQAAKYV